MTAKPVPCPECGTPAVDFRGTDEEPTHYLCMNRHEWPVEGEIPVTSPDAERSCGLARDILAILAKNDGDRGRVEVARRCTQELEYAGAEVPVHRHHPVSAHTPSHESPYERKERRQAQRHIDAAEVERAKLAEDERQERLKAEAAEGADG